MQGLIRSIDRICHESHSRWLSWEKLIGDIPLNKARSIAEVDGMGACVIACMLLNPKIRTGVVQVTHPDEYAATEKYCMVALATAGEQLCCSVTKRGILICFSKKRKILITCLKSATMLGGSDIIIMQFPTIEQYDSLRGGALIVSHIIDNISITKSIQEIEFTGETFKLYNKPKTVARKITWGTNATKTIGSRTGRERETCTRS